LILKEVLINEYHIDVIDFNSQPRAGHATQSVLNDMLKKATFAIIVMTGEDLDIDGKMHARENVIHEIGLFQGKLGFDKCIILFEEGTNEFSNIVGLTQIRFKRGNIKDKVPEIIDTIRRDFSV
jgi:predicted nucleotide-binding protein